MIFHITITQDSNFPCPWYTWTTGNRVSYPVQVWHVFYMQEGDIIMTDQCCQPKGWFKWIVANNHSFQIGGGGVVVLGGGVEDCIWLWCIYYTSMLRLLHFRFCSILWPLQKWVCNAKLFSFIENDTVYDQPLTYEIC